MKHFDDFLDGDTSVSPVFMDKARLYEAADIIQKLQLIAQELPPKQVRTLRRWWRRRDLASTVWQGF